MLLNRIIKGVNEGKLKAYGGQLTLNALLSYSDRNKNEKSGEKKKLYAFLAKQQIFEYGR